MVTLRKAIHNGLNNSAYYTAIRVSVIVYAGLLGIVWLEPAPADLLFVPALILATPILWPRRRELLRLALPILVPLVASVAWWYIRGGNVNLRFLVIDLYILVVFLWVYGVLAAVPASERMVRGSFVAWAAVLILSVSVGAVALFQGTSVLFGSVRVLRSGVRLQGFFKDPNVMAAAIIPALLYTFYRAIRGSKKMAWLHALFMVFLGIGLIFTFSRAGWLAGFVAFVSQAVFLAIKGSKKERWRLVLLVTAGLLAIALLLIINPPMVNRNWPLQNIFFKRFQLELYDGYRFAAWRAAVDLIRENPIFGVGTGAFEAYHGLSVHNTYLRFVVERGILGLAGLVIFVYLNVRGKSLFPKNREFLLFAALGLGINMLFIDALHWRHLAVVVALLLSSGNLGSESGSLEAVNRSRG